ncbi:hypothetical protein IJV79_01725 [bacterium]|nr:hypothetical protein [bacterium]
MVDNRSAGFYGIGGAFNFKSGSISGTVANLADDKMGQGSEYMLMQNEDEQPQDRFQYVDRSAQLRATLNSLAMLNVANVLNERKRLEKLAKKQEKNIFKTDFEYFDDDEFGQEFLDEIDEFENSSV